MSNNIYGIDLGTCNMKVYCKATNKILNEKNTVALINKNQIYAYGDDAYAMYEKAPESIQVMYGLRTCMSQSNSYRRVVLNYVGFCWAFTCKR